MAWLAGGWLGALVSLGHPTLPDHLVGVRYAVEIIEENKMVVCKSRWKSPKSAL